MSMFTNYDNQASDYIPDNRIEFLGWDKEYKDSIVPGATCTHVFELALNYNTDVKSTTITYEQGTNITLTKTSDDIEVQTSADGKTSFVYVVLSPANTGIFNDYNKDLSVQLRMVLMDNSVIYSRVYKLKLVKTLEK